MKHILRLFLIISLVIIGSPANAQHAPVKKIMGMVIDSASTKPIPNATIIFTASNGNPGVGKTKTISVHADGRFKVRLDHNYFWDMTISAPGYESYTWKGVNSRKEYKGVFAGCKIEKESVIS